MENKKSLRDLRPSIGHGGYYPTEEPCPSNGAGSWTTCIFTKPGDREDFIAWVEFKERLAPKDFHLRLLHPGEEKLSEEPGRWEVFNANTYYYGNTLLDAVRRARAYEEADPELLP